MIHAMGCYCFDCKNGYTPANQQASLIYRKWRKPTGKRNNRTRIIKLLKKDKGFKEILDKLNFIKTI